MSVGKHPPRIAEGKGQVAFVLSHDLIYQLRVEAVTQKKRTSHLAEEILLEGLRRRGRAAIASK